MRYPGKIVADLVVAGRYGRSAGMASRQSLGESARQDTLTGPGPGQGGSRSFWKRTVDGRR
jgi:hypothetical protein